MTDHTENRTVLLHKKPTRDEWLEWAFEHEHDTDWVYNLTPEQRVWLAQQASDLSDF
jgi:hypothetical protein